MTASRSFRAFLRDTVAERGFGFTALACLLFATRLYFQSGLGAALLAVFVGSLIGVPVGYPRWRRKAAAASRQDVQSPEAQSLEDQSNVHVTRATPPTSNEDT